MSKVRILRWICSLSYLAYIAFIATVVSLNEAAQPGWNPSIRDDAQVMGVWSDARHKLLLARDHRYTYDNRGVVISGRWRRDDWNLYLCPGSGVSCDAESGEAANTLEFIEFGGRNRLLTDPPDDPDNWDHTYGLNKN